MRGAESGTRQRTRIGAPASVRSAMGAEAPPERTAKLSSNPQTNATSANTAVARLENMAAPFPR